jgi:hypothetical protein
MKRAATVLAVAAIGSSLGATGAFAATATATKYDVVVSGTFKTKSAATKEITKLKAKKLTGFKAVKSGKTYKVERVFTSKSKANAELAKLKKDGFKGKVAKA